MAQKKLAWLLNRECPDEWLDRLGKTKNESEQLKLLVEAHGKKWIEILGSTDQSTRDIAAVLQEFMSVQVVTNEPRYHRGNDAE